MGTDDKEKSLPDFAERFLKTASDDDVHRMRIAMDAMREVFATPPAPLPKLTAAQRKTLDRAFVRTVTGNGYPEHSYVLAKDECADMGYNGPKWAPFNLWHQCEYGASGSNPARTKECARLLLHGAGAGDMKPAELWALIAARYARPDNIASVLPERCADYLDQWAALQKVTPREHKNARLRLKRHAEQLATELARFFDRWDYDESGELNFTQLLSEPEQEAMYERIRRHNHILRNTALKDAGVRARNYADYVGEFDPNRPISPWNPSPSAGDTGETLDLMFSVVPPLPDMMRRIATLFADDGEVPPLQRPNADNAERNFFTRSLIRYFLHEHGDMSPTIVARIVSLFFAQGITENEVSKQVAYLPDGRRMPWKPETSPSK